MSDPKPAPGFFPRALAMILLGVMVHLWCTHHLGTSLAGIGWISALAAAFSAGLALLDKLAEEEEKKHVTKRLQRAAGILLAKPVLVILYMVALLFGMSYASVTVVPDAEGDRLGAQLQAVGSGKIREKRSGDGVPRFLVPTNPFGRSYRIKVSGYLNHPIEVYPLIGLKIKPIRDLRPSPSVLLRPNNDALRDLDDEAVLVVHLLEEGKAPWEIGRHGPEGKRSSFLLGPPRRIPSAFLEDWELELRGIGFSGGHDGLIPTLIRDWKRPKKVEIRRDLEPGMRLRAEILTKAGKCSAREEFILDRENLVDIYLNLCGAEAD